MRPDEIVRLRWEDAEDFEGDYPKIGVQGKIKRRVVPLSHAAVRVLREMQPDAEKRRGWIFPARSPQGHLTVDSDVHARIKTLAGL
jgi:integrase